MKREQTRHRSYKTRKTLDTPVRETAEPHAQPASRAVTRTGMTAAGGKVGFAGEAKWPGRAKLWGPRQGERTQKIRGVWGILAGDGVVSVGEGVVFGDVTDVHWE